MSREGETVYDGIFSADREFVVEELDRLFAQAQSGDLDAYGGMVRRFQDMAVGYAYSILGDFHLAEDAAQEAFIETFLRLGRLYGPAVFPAWLRRAVYKHCDRMTRGRQLVTVPLEDAPELSSGEPSADELLGARETEEGVRRAVQALPEKERTVTALFYMGSTSRRSSRSSSRSPRCAGPRGFWRWRPRGFRRWTRRPWARTRSCSIWG